MKRISVDLNVRVHGNQTYAGFEDTEQPVHVGEQVLAWEPEDDIVADATVTEVDGQRRLIYLAVDWYSFRQAGGVTS